MQAKEFLMIPGPTPVPDEVLEAIARDPLGHRTKEFSKVLTEVGGALKKLAGCEGEVLTLTASGTGAMEAAISNMISPGEKVLSCICGVFGERWAKIAQAFGASVEKLNAEPGEAVSVDALRERLQQDKDKTIKVVTITHNETSTGVVNDLQQLALAVREHGALCIVDAVTSFGAVPISFSEWGIDVMVAGSQKALMLPPGLAVVFMSERAWEAQARSSTPKFYFDLAKYRNSLEQETTPFTPNVSFVVALKTSLDMMKQEGYKGVYDRHGRMKRALRAGVTGMGLKLFVKDENAASSTITAIVPPSTISVDAIRRSMKERFNIRIADGQDALKGKIFRIGHMGYVFERDILMTLAALEGALTELGYKCPAGIGVGSALAVISMAAQPSA
jgi:aspartate aminotransferase-like enzyme